MAITTPTYGNKTRTERPRPDRIQLKGQKFIKLLSITEREQDEYIPVEERSYRQPDPANKQQKVIIQFVVLDKNGDAAKGHGQFESVWVNAKWTRPPMSAAPSALYVWACRLLNEGQELDDAQFANGIAMLNAMESEQPVFYGYFNSKGKLDDITGRVPEDELAGLPDFVPGQRERDPRSLELDEEGIVCEDNGRPLWGFALEKARPEDGLQAGDWWTNASIAAYMRKEVGAVVSWRRFKELRAQKQAGKAPALPF